MPTPNAGTFHKQCALHTTVACLKKILKNLVCLPLVLSRRAGVPVPSPRLILNVLERQLLLRLDENRVSHCRILYIST